MHCADCIEPCSEIQKIGIRWAGSGERIILGMSLILSKQAEECFWQEACV